MYFCFTIFLKMANYTLYLKGFVGGYNFDPDFIDWKLDREKGNPVSVLICSRGGSVPAASSIVSAFRRHGNVSVHFAGWNASAATVCSMGAKHISIDEDALYLVHRASAEIFEWQDMNEEQLANKIKEMDKIRRDLAKVDNLIAEMYASRCKKTKDELLDLMKIGGWLTAQEALEWGFVDEITSYTEDKNCVEPDAVDFFDKAGTPVPKNFINNSQKDNLLHKILDTVTSFLKSNLTTMIKPKNICEFLDVKELPDTLNKEQVEKVEDKIAELQNSLSSKDTTIAELNDKIKNLEDEINTLKKGPADETDDVIDTAKKPDAQKDDLGNFIQNVHRANKIFDSLP